MPARMLFATSESFASSVATKYAPRKKRFARLARILRLSLATFLHVSMASSGAPSTMSTVSLSGRVALVAVMKFLLFSTVVPGGKSYPCS